MADSDTSDIAAVHAQPEPHAPETVYFAKKARTDYRKDKAFRAAAWLSGRVRWIGFGVAVVFLGICLHYVAGVNTDPLDLLLVVCLAAFPFAIWPAVSNWRFRRLYGSRLPLTSSEEWKLCCIGVPEELADCGEWADVPFEPALFFGRFAIRGRGWPRWLYVGTAAAAFLVLLRLAALWAGPKSTQLFIPLILASLGVAEAATAFLWPTYLRLVPGRLDVLGYAPLSRKPVFVDKYDLRDAKITADLRRLFVSIVSPRGRLEFGISLMRERKRFVYMLFLAAMSTFQPAPLPEDELVG